MGVGKTTLGISLAKALSMGFFDIDSQIEYSEKKSIAEIFTLHGEAYFRSLEASMCKKISTITDCVVSTGGGIVLDPQNHHILQKYCTILHLTATHETILQRLENDKSRPLIVDAKKARIAELMAQRASLYSQIADFEIATDNLSVQELVDICTPYILTCKS